jgi:hypothetical protein
MLNFNIAIFKKNLIEYRYEQAKQQIHAILKADSEKAKLICQLVLECKSGLLGLSILQHKIFPYYLPSDQLRQLAQMNQSCAESFSQNPALLEKTGYHFITTLLEKYPSIYEHVGKYWRRYSYETLRQLTKTHTRLLADYFIWVLSTSDSTPEAYLRSNVLSLFHDIDRTKISVTLDTTPEILSLILHVFTDPLENDWQRELCIWITEYHIEKLNLSALLRLLKVYPLSSETAFSSQCCISILSNQFVGRPGVEHLNQIIQSAAVFFNEPIVSLNLLRSLISKHLYSITVKRVVSAFCTQLISPNPKIDIIFLLNVAVFIEELSNKSDILKKKKSKETMFAVSETIAASYHTVSAFTEDDQNELTYIDELLKSFEAAFKIKFYKLSAFTFKELTECITEGLSFQEREHVLKKIKQAYFQSDGQKDHRYLYYEQVYKWIIKKHTKEVSILLHQLVTEQISFDQHALKKHQNSFLRLHSTSPLIEVMYLYSNLDCLYIIVCRSLTEAPLEPLKLELELDIKRSSEGRKQICDYSNFLMKYSPKEHCNEILRWCYFFRTKYYWRAQHIDLIWTNFLQEACNHAFFNGEGHFYYAKMLIYGEEKKDIVPLQYSKKELVKHGSKEIWQYLNPWRRMLEDALAHLQAAKAHHCKEDTIELSQIVMHKIKSMPRYFDVETGQRFHQALKDEVDAHFQKNPDLRINRAGIQQPATPSRPPMPNFDPRALGFSFIELQSSTCARKQPANPSPSSKPTSLSLQENHGSSQTTDEILVDKSADIMEKAEELICATEHANSMMPMDTALPPALLSAFTYEQQHSTHVVKPFETKPEDAKLACPNDIEEEDKQDVYYSLT